jgi:hypothetical protein
MRIDSNQEKEELTSITKGRYFKNTHSGRIHFPATNGILLCKNLRPN